MAVPDVTCSVGCVHLKSIADCVSILVCMTGRQCAPCFGAIIPLRFHACHVYQLLALLSLVYSVRRTGQHHVEDDNHHYKLLHFFSTLYSKCFAVKHTGRASLSIGFLYKRYLVWILCIGIFSINRPELVPRTMHTSQSGYVTVQAVLHVALDVQVTLVHT